MRRAVEGEVDHEVAATFLQRHPEHHVLPRPRRRGGAHPRSRRPGCSAPWTGRPDLVVRAVVWLSQQAGKAILKLTQRDYAEHRLSSLVAQYGSPGALNG